MMEQAFICSNAAAHVLDISPSSQNENAKVADILSRAKRLTAAGHERDQHGVLQKLSDAISRSRAASADGLSNEELNLEIDNTKKEIEKLEQSDQLGKLQDVVSRASLAHSSSIPMDPLDEAAALMHRVRAKASNTTNDDLNQSLALGERIEKLNAVLAKIRDVESRAAALESQAASSNRAEEDIKEADDAISTMKTVLSQSENLMEVDKATELQKPEAGGGFAVTDLEKENADLLNADLVDADNDNKEEAEEAAAETSGDNPADLLSMISPHDSPEQSTLETTIQAIRSASTNPEDATGKLLTLMRSEGDKLEALSDKAAALQKEKDELTNEASQILQDAAAGVQRADQEADAANEYNADIQSRLDILEDHAGAGEESLGRTPYGHDLKELMHTSEGTSRRAEYEARSSQNLAETAEQLSQRVAEMISEVEDQTQMMQEYIGNIKMIAQAALDEAQRVVEPGMVERVESERDSILESAKVYESTVQAMEADIPRETGLGARLRVFADETKKIADGAKNEADCEEAHEAGYEHRFAAATGESMRHIPHECEEGVCEDEDPCEEGGVDCPSVSPVLPPLQEDDPCDEALKDAKSRLGMRSAMTFLELSSAADF